MNWKLIIELATRLLKGDAQLARSLRQKKVSRPAALLLRARQLVLSDEVVCGMILLVLYNTRELPAHLASVDKRLAKVEWHLGLAATSMPPATNAATGVAVQPNVTDQAPHAPGASRFTFLRKNQNEP